MYISNKERGSAMNKEQVYSEILCLRDYISSLESFKELGEWSDFDQLLYEVCLLKLKNLKVKYLKKVLTNNKKMI